MPCAHVAGAIVCSRGRKAQSCGDCGRTSEFLCDFPVASKTCDRPMCSAHATQVGPDRHYCRDHRAAPDAMEALL